MAAISILANTVRLFVDSETDDQLWVGNILMARPSTFLESQASFDTAKKQNENYLAQSILYIVALIFKARTTRQLEEQGPAIK